MSTETSFICKNKARFVFFISLLISFYLLKLGFSNYFA